MKSKDKVQLSLFEAPELIEKEQKTDEKWQYLFVISPSDDVKGKVVGLKLKLNEIVSISNSNLKSTPHISLIAFQQSKRIEPEFWNKFELAIAVVPRFIISLNGFDNFLHGQISNTIYIKIEDPKPVIGLHKLLTRFFKITERNYSPSLTFVRTLPREFIPTIQSFVEQEQFNGKFKCTSITVLERQVIDQKTSNYKIVTTVPLKGD
jgi:hypothetical protein